MPQTWGSLPSSGAPSPPLLHTCRGGLGPYSIDQFLAFAARQRDPCVGGDPSGDVIARRHHACQDDLVGHVGARRQILLVLWPFRRPGILSHLQGLFCFGEGPVIDQSQRDPCRLPRDPHNLVQDHPWALFLGVSGWIRTLATYLTLHSSKLGGPPRLANSILGWVGPSSRSSWATLGGRYDQTPRVAQGVPGAGLPVTSGDAAPARAVIGRHDLGCPLVVSSALVWQGQPRRTSDNEQASSETRSPSRAHASLTTRFMGRPGLI